VEDSKRLESSFTEYLWCMWYSIPRHCGSSNQISFGGVFPEYKPIPEPKEKVDKEKSLQTLVRCPVGVSRDDLHVKAVTIFDDGDFLIISTIVGGHENFLTFDARGYHVLSVGGVGVNVDIMLILLVWKQFRNVCVHSCIPFLQIEFNVCSIIKHGSHHLEVRYGGLLAIKIVGHQKSLN